jgi:hypothetical protein
MSTSRLFTGVSACTLAILAAAGGAPVLAADHSDTALLNLMARQNAQTTDLHAFVRNGKLVLALSMNPAIPVSAASYQFPADLAVEINLDNDSEVSFDDAEALARFGGTIEGPDRIGADITFRITFDAAGAPTLAILSGEHDTDDEGDDEGDDEAVDHGHVRLGHGIARTVPGPSALDGTSAGAHQHFALNPQQGGPHDASIGLQPSQVQMFVGLRDDPFIRCPRAGRNVGAIVLEVALSAVLDDQPTLLVWATSDIDDVFGSSEEIAGRSLRSMFSENDMANVYHPGEHADKLGMVPDVMIYDTSRPAAFPNGRELLDDVVAIVADPRVVNTCPPFPDGNDVPFLPTFPYLAAPHPPVN